MSTRRDGRGGRGVPKAAETVEAPTLYSRMSRRHSQVSGFTKAAPDQTRAVNRTAVLQCLYYNAGLSRADLAREVGLTRVTISDVVAELVTEGLVIELGTRSGSRPGKPATMLDINRTGLCVIGLDLSDSHAFRGAVTDLDGTLLADHNLPLEGRTGDAAVQTVIELLDTLIDQAPTPILGIGVGSPGIVDQRGAVLIATNLEWVHVPLKALLARHTGLTVHVANDANAAAVGERFFGEASGDIMLVRIGSGVGAGLMVAGQQVYGTRSAAGEIGHVVVGTDGGSQCSCGKNGCLETWVSIPALESALASAKNDHEREQVLTEAGRRLGIVTAPVVAALNLTSLVISGPEDVLDQNFMDAVADTLKQRTLDDFHGDVTLRRSTLGVNSIVLGAVALVLATEVGVS